MYINQMFNRFFIDFLSFKTNLKFIRKYQQIDLNKAKRMHLEEIQNYIISDLIMINFEMNYFYLI